MQSIDTFVRDVCSVANRAKSRVRALTTALLEQQKSQIVEKLEEVIADTTLEAQLNFWQKASDFQKGLIKNLKEKNII